MFMLMMKAKETKDRSINISIICSFVNGEIEPNNPKLRDHNRSAILLGEKLKDLTIENKS